MAELGHNYNIQCKKLFQELKATYPETTDEIVRQCMKLVSYSNEQILINVRVLYGFSAIFCNSIHFFHFRTAMSNQSALRTWREAHRSKTWVDITERPKTLCKPLSPVAFLLALRVTPRCRPMTSKGRILSVKLARALAFAQNSGQQETLRSVCLCAPSPPTVIREEVISRAGWDRPGRSVSMMVI